ncbi:hypothetical protein FGG08_005885 [Glutinoglossum americanum]|uniref:Uncharacterized protein n=1 Tax=Glutinoglossum americanum TaxID=1670608 RepID=A0A9P8I8H6_9PEZI|nr:hypothetical protein FGG08_005885 [Glutinoglossum americanum]
MAGCGPMRCGLPVAPGISDDASASRLRNNARIPENVDTVIVGSGPSALILSYLLHGYVPLYDPITHGPHPDPILHSKLSNSSGSLYLALNSPLAIDSLTEHFLGSRLSYSTQALPINVLLDTLLRPNADTACGAVHSRIRWSHEPDKAVPHVVLGCSRRPGGQWSERSKLSSSSDIETLSYAEMLSLPGYPLAELYKEKHARALPEFTRPSQVDVSNYLATYPARVGIEDSVYSSVNVDCIERSSSEGFTVDISKAIEDNRNNKAYTSRIHCRHLVLASGTFSHAIPPPQLLHPLTTLPNPPPPNNNHPLLIIGSGFSAADTIISTQPPRKILHLFLWAPDTHPSPLRSCHQQAYPEYAAVYRRMKLASSQSSIAAGSKGGRGRKIGAAISPTLIQKCSSYFAERDWESTYEGLANAEILSVDTNSDSTGGMEITVQLPGGGGVIHRCVSGLEYLVGRQGSVNYLSDPLKANILPNPSTPNGPPTPLISTQTLRPKTTQNLELTHNVFAIGSLTGDSLIRFAFGGCIYAAGKIIADPSPPTPMVMMLILQNKFGKPVLISSGSTDTTDRGCLDENESKKQRRCNTDGSPDTHLSRLQCQLRDDSTVEAAGAPGVRPLGKGGEGCIVS